MSVGEKTEIKTMAGWHASEYTTWDEYAKPGDLVDESVYDYFLNCMPPVSLTKGYLQVGEPYGYKVDPRTGKYEETYATFEKVEKDVWMYCGKCFYGESYNVNFMAEINSLKEFMKATYHINYCGIQDQRPWIVCKDGFRMSVQAGRLLYCEPREDLKSGEYSKVEVGYPSQKEELLKKYAEEQKFGTDYTKQVYAYVPVEIVEKVIEKHGGFKNE